MIIFDYNKILFNGQCIEEKGNENSVNYSFENCF